MLLDELGVFSLRFAESLAKAVCFLLAAAVVVAVNRDAEQKETNSESANKRFRIRGRYILILQRTRIHFRYRFFMPIRNAERLSRNRDFEATSFGDLPLPYLG